MNKDIENKILNSRILFIDRVIDNELANTIIMQLLYLDSINHEDVSLYINSPGGELQAGLAIIDVMNVIKSKVNTICIGRCYSLAAVILVCGNKGKRAILSNSEVMIHEVGINHMDGKTKDVIKIANMTKEKNEKILNIIAENTKITIKELRKLISTDYYMDSKEAVEKGIVDLVI